MGLKEVVLVLLDNQVHLDEVRLSHIEQGADQYALVLIGAYIVAVYTVVTQAVVVHEVDEAHVWGLTYSNSFVISRGRQCIGSSLWRDSGVTLYRLDDATVLTVNFTDPYVLSVSHLNALNESFVGIEVEVLWT